MRGRGSPAGAGRRNIYIDEIHSFALGGSGTGRIICNTSCPSGQPRAALMPECRRHRAGAPTLQVTHPEAHGIFLVSEDFHLGGPCCAGVGMTFGLPAVAGAFDVGVLQISAVSFACQVDEHLGGAGKGH
ncbi:hypothetical protein Rmet_6322 (plasmid) [Cupriavidus metallidurans CH34]|uniref:Uncharacterized protein n=1 Tax=Cupriavidus metallidurans (strain ATCC 43123 / DSM 2839 / NBRC 102507 / CH34) TaxID=266264 RepID=Q1L9J5_CUPMC|nr:hypothetical protein Rmet_6322 [Cupriavidus metallidurans CH34]